MGKMLKVAAEDAGNRVMRDPREIRFSITAMVYELTLRQFSVTMNIVKNQKEAGSQLRHSIALFRKRNARRTKPGVLSADYIVGLTDGEGSFLVYLLPPKKAHGSVHYRIQCRYYIKMREDELPLLKKVQRFWRRGKIYFQKEYRKNQRDNYRFEIFNYELLEKIVVPFFKRHPLESKRVKDFQIFCKVLDLAITKAHHTQEGLAKIAQLKSQMHA